MTLVAITTAAAVVCGQPTCDSHAVAYPWTGRQQHSDASINQATYEAQQGRNLWCYSPTMASCSALPAMPGLGGSIRCRSTTPSSCLPMALGTMPHAPDAELQQPTGRAQCGAHSVGHYALWSPHMLPRETCSCTTTISAWAHAVLKTIATYDNTAA